MQTKNLTAAQCIRIIENSYLGEHDRKGKQRDYHDHRHEINQQLWELQDKEFGKLIVEQSSPEYEFLRDCIDYYSIEAAQPTTIYDYSELNTVVKKTFNKWAYIAQRISA